MTDYFTGTSGWSYPQWKQGMYEGVPQSKWLACYAEHFTTVEQNSSFYRLPAEKAVLKWAEATPESFRFAVKAWRDITHYKRLRNCEESLEQCMRLFRMFGKNLGPVLFQLPPSFKRDDALLADFLALLPDDITAVFEFRHASWQDKKVYSLLEKHRATLCHPHVMEWGLVKLLPVSITRGCTGRMTGSRAAIPMRS